MRPWMFYGFALAILIPMGIELSSLINTAEWALANAGRLAGIGFAAALAAIMHCIAEKSGCIRGPTE